MTPTQYNFALHLLASFFADRPKQRPSDWCCQFLQFNEPGNSGPFTLAGREYSREILDAEADTLISDEVLVFGSQSGKTGTIMGKAAWRIANMPTRIFWVMPTRDTVQKLSRTRWQPMVRASPTLAILIPVGARRHDFSTFQQMLGGSVIDYVWSNSPAALASVPAPVVILDEVDKFDEGGKREANAVDLANQRTKHFATPKRIKTSTPTLMDGLIWQEFLKTDQRRRFMPCPHCGKFVVLIWSKAYTVFKSTSCEAEVKWDEEAKRSDGSWDLDRVERSAHYLCPHCGGHILDAHKTLMDRNGEWRPTPNELRLSNTTTDSASAARGYRGWHLPSLYAASAETNVGKLAVKFLQAKSSLQGLQGFINGDLAEPYMAQDTVGHRIEIITEKLKDELTGRVRLMTVDVQKDGFWFVIVCWGLGEAHCIDAGHLDTWDEVEKKQRQHGVEDEGVMIDSGDQTKGTGDSVYVKCAEHCIIVPRRNKLGPLPPYCMGWTPSKGMPVYKRWRDEKGSMLPYRVVDIDPYDGTTRAGKVQIGLFEYAADYFKDILANMRAGRGQCKFSVEKSVASDEFWRHMDGEYKGTFFNKKTRKVQEGWILRARYWPNHILDCMVGQVARATHLGLLKVD